MEKRKIKISPEVLKKDIITQTYSGESFGYYSGMTHILSAGTINLGTWSTQQITFIKGTLGAGFFQFLGPNSNIIYINTVGSNGYNWKTYLINLIIGSIIQIKYGNKTYKFITNNKPQLLPPGFDLPTIVETDYVLISITPDGVTENIPYGVNVNLTITQPNTSQLIDLSIPILLKQNYEDVGYYSPFDGELSQLNDDVNFTFTGNPSVNAGQRICVFNTSNYLKNYLKDTEYRISWGDGFEETVTDFIPNSICHDYLPLGIDHTYTISLTGQNNFGIFIINKDVTIPYTFQTSTNPYGKVNFLTNNGSWSTTPTSQNYIYPFDAINNVSYQQSSNFVSVPFVISGNTQSRLNELQVYGLSDYILYPNIINISDGISGYVESISADFTQYVINDVTYFDFANGESIFLASSEGLTNDMLTASAITKYEYLINVIDQPQIQTYVFIERGKYSAMENFRRIGEVNSTGRLVNYGYNFFDVRSYEDI
jgi:hypothetical protein